MRISFSGCVPNYRWKKFFVGGKAVCFDTRSETDMALCRVFEIRLTSATERIYLHARNIGKYNCPHCGFPIVYLTDDYPKKMRADKKCLLCDKENEKWDKIVELKKKEDEEHFARMKETMKEKSYTLKMDFGTSSTSTCSSPSNWLDYDFTSNRRTERINMDAFSRLANTIYNHSSSNTWRPLIDDLVEESYR